MTNKKQTYLLVFAMFFSLQCIGQEEECRSAIKTKMSDMFSVDEAGKDIVYLMTRTTSKSSDLTKPPMKVVAEYLSNINTLVYKSDHVDIIKDKDDSYTVVHFEKKIYPSGRIEEHPDQMNIMTMVRDSIINDAIIQDCSCSNLDFDSCDLTLIMNGYWKNKYFINDLVVRFDEKKNIKSYTFNYVNNFPNKYLKIEVLKSMMDYPYKGKFTAREFVKKNGQLKNSRYYDYVYEE